MSINKIKETNRQDNLKPGVWKNNFVRIQDLDLVIDEINDELSTIVADETSIYSADGILAGNRVIDGDGNTLSIDGASEFNVNSNDSNLIASVNDTTIQSTAGSVALVSDSITFNGFQSLITEEIELEAADIIAMNGAPVALVSAQAGKVIQLVDGIMIYDYGTITFTGGGAVDITNGTDTLLQSPVAAVDSLLDTADNINTFVAADTTITAENTGLFITNDTAAFADGDGVLRVIVTYRLFTTGL